MALYLNFSNPFTLLFFTTMELPICTQANKWIGNFHLIWVPLFKHSKESNIRSLPCEPFPCLETIKYISFDECHSHVRYPYWNLNQFKESNCPNKDFWQLHYPYIHVFWTMWPNLNAPAVNLINSVPLWLDIKCYLSVVNAFRACMKWKIISQRAYLQYHYL